MVHEEIEMSHWKSIITNSRYRKKWSYNLMVATSQLTLVFWYGGDPDQTLSGEIGRRILNRQKLGWFLSTIKWIVERVLGSGHWYESLNRDDHYQDVRNKHGHGFKE
jgi:hypothetical protein